MSNWKPDRLLRAILIWTAITMLVVWLPLVRGVMDGDSYEWGNSLWGIQLSGSGLSGDYWVLLVVAPVGLWLLYLGWRGAQQPFHWLLLLWHLPLAANAVVNSIRHPEELRFRGDSLGIDVSLAWVGPVVFGGFALLALIWAIRDLRRREQRTPPAWSRANRGLLALAVLLLAVQFVLFRFGPAHGTADAVGVGVTLLQWLLVNLALMPHAAERGE